MVDASSLHLMEPRCGHAPGCRPVRHAPVDAAFNSIITQNEQMRVLMAQAQILASKQVPLLIHGETGTGKELFARAIHNAGGRAAGPFIAVNCGAIPTDLVDSVLFGHRKGAFTGAVADRDGVFQQADGGTLFLDEFGELKADVQVRLLRVLQEGTFTPVGASRERRVNVRIIAATHRNLMQGVAEGRFREDLFYRIAQGVLHLPPLRERAGDLPLLPDANFNAQEMLEHRYCFRQQVFRLSIRNRGFARIKVGRFVDSQNLNLGVMNSLVEKAFPGEL